MSENETSANSDSYMLYFKLGFSFKDVVTSNGTYDSTKYIFTIVAALQEEIMRFRSRHLKEDLWWQTQAQVDFCELMVIYIGPSDIEHWCGNNLQTVFGLNHDHDVMVTEKLLVNENKKSWTFVVFLHCLLCILPFGVVRMTFCKGRAELQYHDLFLGCRFGDRTPLSSSGKALWVACRMREASALNFNLLKIITREDPKVGCRLSAVNTENMPLHIKPKQCIFHLTCGVVLQQLHIGSNSGYFCEHRQFYNP